MIQQMKAINQIEIFGLKFDLFQKQDHGMVTCMNMLFKHYFIADLTATEAMQASAPNKSNSNTTVALPAPISTPAMKTDQVQTGGFICVGPPCPIDTQSEFESIRTQENSTPIHSENEMPLIQESPIVSSVHRESQFYPLF